MSLDRTIPPPSEGIPPFQFAWPTPHQLDNGCTLWSLSAGQQPLIKLELITRAGTLQEPASGIASFTAKMLREGTKDRDAAAIVQIFEQYGAKLDIHTGLDTCHWSLTTLRKHLQPVLALWTTLFTDPSFPEERLQHLQRLQRQALRVAQQKHGRVAHQQLRKALFGDHPYGRILDETAISQLDTDQLRAYHAHQLLKEAHFLVSGGLLPEDIALIQKYLGALPTTPSGAVQATPPTLLPPQTLQIPGTRDLQAAVCVGRLACHPTDPDFIPLHVVNTLLGGYFGSRLMSNIREDKGYTYGIFSQLMGLHQGSYLVTATEVMHQHADNTLREIQHELTTLQQQPVSTDEIDLLRQYMLGKFLSHINDPWSIMERFKTVHLHGHTQDYYQQLYQDIAHLNADRIMQVAQQYFSWEDFTQVVVR